MITNSTMEINQFGTKEWRNEKKKFHREDGPALEFITGTKSWYLNGKCHREGGPAIEFSNGDKYWFINGQRHREDGPAIECVNGKKFWYLNDKELSEAEFLKKSFEMKSKMTINQYGTKEWRNEKGQRHREDGPAVECANGSKSWFINGKYHREDGPAVECANGSKSWFINGKYHREDGPAIEYADGNKYWYLNGQQHREGGPAIECANGDKAWYLNDRLHREDGPAIEYADEDKYWYLNGKELSEAEFLKKSFEMKSKMTINQYGTKEWRNEKEELHRKDGPAIEYADGDKYWCLNGQRHREDGPAVECSNGSKYWYLNDQLHREDGPAIEYADGSKYYYLKGKELSEADFTKLYPQNNIKKIINNEMGFFIACIGAGMIMQGFNLKKGEGEENKKAVLSK